MLCSPFEYASYSGRWEQGAHRDCLMHGPPGPPLPLVRKLRKHGAKPAEDTMKCHVVRFQSRDCFLHGLQKQSEEAVSGMGQTIPAVWTASVSLVPASLMLVPRLRVKVRGDHATSSEKDEGYARKPLPSALLEVPRPSVAACSCHLVEARRRGSKLQSAAWASSSPAPEGPQLLLPLSRPTGVGHLKDTGMLLTSSLSRADFCVLVAVAGAQLMQALQRSREAARKQAGRHRK